MVVGFVGVATVGAVIFSFIAKVDFPDDPAETDPEKCPFIQMEKDQGHKPIDVGAYGVGVQ